MLFSGKAFLFFFLPIVIFVYYVLLKKRRFMQNLFLLIASLFFYAWGEPTFVLVMLLSIAVNWFMGLIISKSAENKRKSKMILSLDIAVNLGILFVFKYLTFTCSIFDKMFGANLPIPEITLPIGISFFTFQAMSYVIDVYRKSAKVQKNILYVGLYISLFPQLIAGPIVRYQTIADEIENRRETVDDFFDGFARFTIGLSKKVLLANGFAFLADQAFNDIAGGNSISVMFGWLGAIAYTLQIFFDFSGYSDMAIGLGKMFGFHFLENFNYPYISTSITEFWRRWHMSLGTWFRDYLYFPLGGSRCSKMRNIFNLFVVWFLTGLWHGANYTFIVWGLMYFVLLVIEKLTGIYKKNNKYLNVFKYLYTSFFVVIGWVIFRADDIEIAWTYVLSMFGLNGNTFSDGMFTGWFTQNMILLCIGILCSTPVFKILSEKTKNNSAVSVVKTGGLMVLFFLSVAGIMSSYYNPFIYFNF